MKEQPFVFMHLNLNGRGCGKPAFYLTKRLTGNDPITADVVVWLDGTQSKNDEPIACGSCGRGLDLDELHPACITSNDKEIVH